MLNGETELDFVPFEVEAIIQHPNYETGLIRDFSLIKLEKAVDFAKYPYMRPICLPQFDNEVSKCNHSIVHCFYPLFLGLCW